MIEIGRLLSILPVVIGTALVALYFGGRTVIVTGVILIVLGVLIAAGFVK